MLEKYCLNLRSWLSGYPVEDYPWSVTQRAAAILVSALAQLDSDYQIAGEVAIHRTARVETGAILKGPLVIGAGCFIASHAYLRGGVFLASEVTIGPGCEVKASFIGPGSALAHFNFVGDSIVGSGVNLEAGAVIANHWNEREDKSISVVVDGSLVATHTEKFGALVGDGARIGANAVLSPGTLLSPGAIVARLSLVDQVAALNDA